MALVLPVKNILQVTINRPIAENRKKRKRRRKRKNDLKYACERSGIKRNEKLLWQIRWIH
jgi:hypothetical protein